MGRFSHIVGNEEVKRYLCRAIERGEVGGSWLFIGKEGIGKGLFARAFAQALLCKEEETPTTRERIERGNHPDLSIYRPEGKVGMHALDAMRRFGDEVFQRPTESAYRLFIIESAERMITYSAHALLKAFEEPLESSIILLLTTSRERVLPTIASRCRPLYFAPLSESEVAAFLERQRGASPELARRAAATAAGSIGEGMSALEEGEAEVRTLLIDLLSGQGTLTYTSMDQIATKICRHYTAKGEREERQVKETLLLNEKSEALSPLQKQAAEREAEAAATLTVQRGFTSLLERLLFWYRDLHLLKSGAGKAYLFYRERREQLAAQLQRGTPLPLEVVQSHVSEVLLALERSTPLEICLELLLLRLGLCR